MTAILPPRRLAPSRRRALIDLALGTAAFGLLGCGEQARAQSAAPATGDEAGDAAFDVGALQAQVALERAAIAAYEAGRAAVGADLRPVLEAFAGHHAAHAAEVEAALAALDVEPEPWAPPQFPDLDGELSVLRYALLLESQAAHAYLAAISQFRSAGHVARAADILGSEIAHVVVLRQALAEEIGPDLAHAFDLAFVRDLALPANNG